MTDPNCPTHEELAAYHYGELEEEAAAPLIEHISRCVSCQALLQTFDEVGDTLIARLRRPIEQDPYAGELQREEFFARARAMNISRGASAGQRPGRSPAEAPFPRELGEYELLAKLGQGGMGAVYKARHTRLDRIVAVKVLPKEKTTDERAVARFEREMKAVGRLNHPNIVQAYDARDIAGTTVLVMEHVDGADLSHIVKRHGPLKLSDACELIRQAALGLQYAHESGLVHRDIKPSNLMLSRDGQLKILDMGLALLQSGESPAADGGELTSAGQAMGTADYMAPEQVSDSHSVDIRADIYSLGCTLYKLLTGHAPFSGPQYKTPLEKLMGHVRDAARPIQILRTDVPDDLAAVINRMIAKNVAERIATPGEVAEAIGSLSLWKTGATTSSDLGRLLATSEGSAETSLPAPGTVATEPVVSSALTGTVPHAAEPLQAGLARWLGQRKRWKVAIGLVVLFVASLAAFQIVVRIRDKQGRETVFHVPAGAEMNVTADGQVEIGMNLGNAKSSDDEPGKATAGSKSAPENGSNTVSDRAQSDSKSERVDLEPGSPMNCTALVTKPISIPGLRSWTIETRDPRHALASFALSADGHLAALGDRFGCIRVWNTRTGELHRVLVGHDDIARWNSVSGLAWSPDAKLLASSGNDRRICFWNVQTGALVRVFQRTAYSPPQALAWSSDARWLAAAASNGTIVLWQMDNAAKPRSLPIPAGANREIRIAWSPDAQVLASTDTDGSIRLWSPSEGQLLHTYRPTTVTGPIRDLAWAPEARSSLWQEGEKTERVSSISWTA